MTTPRMDAQSETRRLYDGLNAVQERDGSNATMATYVRGLDMGGGIGGLLARASDSVTSFLHYDGRGNVVQLSSESGLVSGRYTYDAFGRVLSMTSGAAGLNPYRFCTKEQIGSLVYYGFRFYSPSMGRWINRDPIEERGGVNLYGFVDNSPIVKMDAYGYASIVENPFPYIGQAPWLVYGHAYIYMKRKCMGHHTFGLHFGNMSNPGTIKIPDPSGSEVNPQVKDKGIHILTNNDPRFEAALCECIKKSVENPPPYTAFSVCGSWAHNMWECAKSKLGKPSVKLPTFIYKGGTSCPAYR